MESMSSRENDLTSSETDDQSQLQVLQSENTKLHQASEERSIELSHLRKQLSEMKQKYHDIKESQETLGPGGYSGAAASKKIMELSKKLRHKTSELEVEKSRTNKLQSLLDKATEEKEEMAANKVDEEVNKSVDKSEAEVLTTKVKQLNSKLNDYRNQVQTIQRELKLVYKALQNEVGETCDLASLVQGTTDGRNTAKGRAQQICLLQAKVAALTDEFKGETKSDTQIKHGLTSRNDKKQREELKRMDRERQEMVEKLRSDLEAEKLLVEKLKYQLEGQKARVVSVQQDLRGSKAQVETLRNKSHHDDDLIRALMEQQNHMKRMVSENSRLQQQGQDLAREEERRREVEEKKHAEHANQLERVVAENDNHIKALEQSVREAQEKATCRGCAQRQRDAEQSRKLHEAAEIQSRRLTEMVKGLDKRVEEKTRQVINLQKEKQQLTRENELLHQEVGKHMARSKRPWKSDRSSSLPTETKVQREDTIIASSSCKKEIEELRKALNETLIAKAEDLELCDKIIEETKLLFLDGGG